MAEYSEGRRAALKRHLESKQTKIIGPTRQEADEVNNSQKEAHSWLRKTAKKVGQGTATILGISGAMVHHNLTLPPTTELRIDQQSRDPWAKEYHQTQEAISEFKGPLSFGVIKGVREKAEKPGEDPEVARARITLDRVSQLLKEGRVDLLLTPEYSFFMEKHPLRIIQTAEGFEKIPDQTRCNNIFYPNFNV
jgi:hypothetical protein